MGYVDPDEILNEYEQTTELCEEFTQRLRELLSQVLVANSIHFHSVTHRLKTRDSLEKKLTKSGDKYASLNEVTDICGIRVITFFDDDVDRVAGIIEGEFEVDEENSVDKRDLLDPDRFGYLSVHYVVAIDENRKRLTEYSKFGDLKVEIQVRSILQHAWAEMEHDLGYKAKFEVPRNIQRRFSQLAGLLELADKEFTKIRDELGQYEEEVTEKVVSQAEDFYIDKASLLAFVQTSDTLAEIDNAISASTGIRIEFVPSYVNLLIKTLHYCDLMIISDLEQELEENRDLLIPYTVRNLENYEGDVLSAGIGLWHLVYFLLAKTGSATNILRYMEKFKIGEDDRQHQSAQKYLQVYDELAAGA